MLMLMKPYLYMKKNRATLIFHKMKHENIFLTKVAYLNKNKKTSAKKIQWKYTDKIHLKLFYIVLSKKIFLIL